jgi:hypothetical protein
MAPSGRLFAVTFRVVGLTTDSTIGYQSFLVTHPYACFQGSCRTISIETPAVAVFGNLPALVPGYTVTVTPSFTFDAATGLLVGTFAVTVANSTDGTVLFSKTFSVSVKVNIAGDARFLLVAPVAPAAIAVSLDINNNARSANGLVLGNPDMLNQGKVNLLDVVIVAIAYGAAHGSLRYSLAFDLNRDGIINILDLALLLSHYDMPAFR